MASNTLWKPGKNGEEHPEDSSLLAYIRQQHLEDQSKINQHIDIERCPRCLRRRSELEQVSKTLDVLGQMPPYQHYPELSAAQMYAHVQRTANRSTFLQAYLHWVKNRQRPRKSVVRLVSLPAAFALVILFTVALVFADLAGVPLIPRSLPGGTSPSQNGSTGVAPQVATPTPDIPLTATANANATAIASQPYIQVCSTPADIAQSRLVICGYNFEAGHKVSLVVTISGKAPVTRQPVLVDKQGDFQDSWYVHCRNLPAAIFAYEVDNVKVFSSGLANISFAACPTAIPGSG